MAGTDKTEFFEYGLHVYRSRHQQIRRLKRLHSPCFHGFRVWPSSWLLMDFFERSVLPRNTRVMEVGCGWGLAGIYCSKKYGAAVTSVDIDPEVFPYLRLHSEINSAPTTTLTKGFEQLTQNHLKDVNVVIGADICFWDTMADPLADFIGRALDTGVQMVLISDPGRMTFDNFTENLDKKLNGEVWNQTVQHPYCVEGKILKIGSLPATKKSTITCPPIRV